MARALVTGGAGFIGSHLVDHLLRSGHTVRVLDNLTTGTRQNLELGTRGLEFIEGDIRDAAVVDRATQDIDWVFHLAALVSVPESVERPRVAMDVNVRGTAIVAYSATRAGVQRFLFASSCAVYGDTGPGAVGEDAPTHPLSPYGASKLMGECLLSELHQSGRLPTLSCRFFNVFGSRQRADSPYSGVIALFVDRARRRLPLRVYGDGEQTRDFIAVADVVDLLVRAAAGSTAVWPNAINVGSGRAVTIRQLADLVRRQADGHVPVEFAAERRGDLRHSCAVVTCAADRLDWRARVTLDEGIAAIWNEAPARN